MSVSIGIEADKQTTAIVVVNALFLSAFVLDVASAFLAFLTSRWFQQLNDEEEKYLEEVFSNSKESNSPSTSSASLIQRLLHRWFALSLFVAMPLLIIATTFMTVGILVYAWSQQPLRVAIVTTVALALPVPFIAGIFLIGKDPNRRTAIISSLSVMRGDW
jgi:hypothetical protein